MQTRSRQATRWIGLAGFLGIVLSAHAARAQGGRWEVEWHGGGSVAGNPDGGAASIPGPGESIATAGIYPPPAPQVIVTSTTRRVSSWYFGDGARLFNQAAVSVAANPVAMTAPFAGRIVPLDPLLASSLAEMPSGGTIGARVSRALTERFSAEVSVDYGLARLRVTDGNAQAIDATAASFSQSFRDLIMSAPNRTLRSVSSTASSDRGDAHQLSTTAALVVNLLTRGRVTPYATVGAGVISILGDLPAASLTGNYQFLSPSGAPFNESDNVVVRDARRRHSFAGVLGGGVKYGLAKGWGLRVDARVALNRNPAATQLDAAPNVVLGETPGGRVTLNADPTIQFGNSSGPVTGLGITALAPSSLSGPALAGVRTWKGSGVAAQTTLAIGLYRRF